MSDTTGIEWTDSTFNPVIGCTKVSAGCDHCYAEALVHRYGWTEWGPGGVRKRTSPGNWRKPMTWNRKAEAAGRRHRVFCASLADVFDARWPTGVRDDLWSLIRRTPHLDWQLLTKRPGNIRRMLPSDWGQGWPNVWLGISAEDQAAFDHRWPILESVPARIRFISYEPALGPVTLGASRPDWVILGGESGRGARRWSPSWARDLIAECTASGIAVFLKQWGTIASNPLVSECGLSISEASSLDRDGKGGSLLDGVHYKEFPG